MKKDFDQYLKYYGGRVPRRIDSMTAEEWNDIKNFMSLDVNHAFQQLPMFKDKPWHVLILENRVSTNTLRFNDGIKLIEYGYWVFGDEYFEQKESIIDT